MAQGLFRDLADFWRKCAHIHCVGNCISKQARYVFDLCWGNNVNIAGDI